VSSDTTACTVFEELRLKKARTPAAETVHRCSVLASAVLVRKR
jgi:hypothetical protein